MQTELQDAAILDLFAGSGALGLEMLSRGARHVTFVEQANTALRTLKTNAEKLSVDAGAMTVVRSDAVGYVAAAPELAFDVAVADPPYHQGLAVELLRLFAQRPFARWFWVEHASSEAMPDLPDLHTRRYGDTSLTSITAAQ